MAIETPRTNVERRDPGSRSRQTLVNEETRCRGYRPGTRGKMALVVGPCSCVFKLWRVRLREDWRRGEWRRGEWRRSAGMTLVELLVVITILTTLVAGVIPILSPNNDVRKLGEASRAVQSFISSAQSEAARVARPHGIGIRESAPGSGAALELFHLETPPPFAGFSEYSYATAEMVSDEYYGPSYAGGTRFVTNFDSANLYLVDFAISGGSDPFPPQFLRIGDQVEIDDYVFLIVDDSRNAQEFIGPNGEHAFLTSSDQVYAICTTYPYRKHFRPMPDLKEAQTAAFQPPDGGSNNYKIYRQPTASMEPPLQLPSGIAIDMVASGVEGQAAFDSAGPSLLIPGSFYNLRMQLDFDPPRTNEIGIIFSETGGIERVYANGVETGNLNRVFLLLGRVENVVTDVADTGHRVDPGMSNREIEDIRERVNWLNGDSRWIGISATSGRAVTTENPQTDLRQFDSLSPADQRIAQIDAAREFVREMRQLTPN